MMRYRERVLTGPGRRAGMCFDPAQVPTELMEPSMEAGQPGPAHARTGWECPRCHRVYAPWVACCGTCGPESAEARTEITEGGFEPTSQAMRRAGIKPEDVLEKGGLDKVADAVRSARGGDAPAQVRGFA